MNEGSVAIDNGGLPSQVVGDDSSKGGVVADTGDNGAGTGNQVTDEGAEGADKVVVTDKGTKLDPNPLSAAHQLLANASKKVDNYERVLSDPDLLRRYAKEAGISLTEAKAEIKEEIKGYTPDMFPDAQKLADVLNELRAGSEKTIGELKAEIQSLREGFTGTSESLKNQAIVNSMATDVQTVQEKYPALNPKSPEYNKELESKIGLLYQELDFDPRTGKAQGRISLAKLADQIMSTVSIGQKQGSDRAQTEVVSKQAGRVVTSSKSASGKAESTDPGTVIAQRIAKAMGNK